MITKFKSIQTIISGLYRDLGTNTELNESDIIEWAGEALMLIGAYPQFVENISLLEVTNHTAKVPTNFLYLKSVTNSKTGHVLSWNNKSAVTNYNCPECKIPTCCTEDNFYIHDCQLNTSLNCGTLCFTYIGLPVDCDGYPMMPDDVYYDKALKAYCTYMLDKIQFRKGTLPQAIFQFSEKEWLWYVGAAKGSANTLDTNAMERIKNVWVRLIPRQNEFRNNFNNLGKPEQRHLH